MAQARLGMVRKQTHEGLRELAELAGLDARRRLTTAGRAELGQVFTPSSVSRFMAGWLRAPGATVRLLDPGAGVGALTAAAVAELLDRDRRPRRLEVTAYEVDPALAGRLRGTLAACRDACGRAGVEFHEEVIEADFIAEAVRLVWLGPRYEAVIMNPPYRKIHSASRHRRMLRSLGLEITNLYAGFLAAAVGLLEDGGELVAITPRSFCNGPYFRPFREYLLRATALEQLHVFGSREAAFAGDDVLQENVIFRVVRAAEQREVTVTASDEPGDAAMTSRVVPFAQVVQPDDPQVFIHLVPDELGQRVADRMARLPARLDELGVEVSTGRVVDFRAAEHLRREPGADTVPLIYPAHLSQGGVTWPIRNAKKADAIVACPATAHLLVPNGDYVLVRRLSSKEERRRVVAVVYRADDAPSERVAFENHLNYYHRHGGPLPADLARGLAAYLNATLVDSYFRLFNGHTQVNATDLRSLRYPTEDQLRAIAARVSESSVAQDELDDLVAQELFGMANSTDPDPIAARQRLDEAVDVLGQLGFPEAVRNERSALALLALLDLTPGRHWSEASDSLMGITQMMDWFREHYGKDYAPNTRETVRDETVAPFLEAGLILKNPDDPARATTSPRTCYQIEPGALALLRSHGTESWQAGLPVYLATRKTFRSGTATNAAERASRCARPGASGLPSRPGSTTI